jgi:DNA uptake protein ComE-like DNA-binding protein
MSKHKLFREGFPPAAQPDPTAHTQPGDFDVDLNTASYHQLVVIPMLGRERARAVLEARPFTRWEQVRHLPDFNDKVVEDLRKGGARIRKAA